MGCVVRFRAYLHVRQALLAVISARNKAYADGGGDVTQRPRVKQIFFCINTSIYSTGLSARLLRTKYSARSG